MGFALSTLFLHPSLLQFLFFCFEVHPPFFDFCYVYPHFPRLHPSFILSSNRTTIFENTRREAAKYSTFQAGRHANPLSCVLRGRQRMVHPSSVVVEVVEGFDRGSGSSSLPHFQVLLEVNGDSRIVALIAYCHLLTSCAAVPVQQRVPPR